MNISIVVTDAGLAEIANAQQNGTNKITLSEVGVGTGQYLAYPTQTALASEIKRIATVSGITVSDNQIHMIVRDDSSDIYDVSEFGIYTDTGVLFAVFSNPSAFLSKKEKSMLFFAIDIEFNNIDANTLIFGDTTFLNPQATETVKGVAQIASNSDVYEGTSDSKIITPAKLTLATLTDSDANRRANQSGVAINNLRTSGLWQMSGAEPENPSGEDGVCWINMASADYGHWYFHSWSGKEYKRTLAGGAFVTSWTKITDETDLSSALAALVDASPSTLDTLNELAAALGDDPNFSTTITNLIATKAPLDSAALTGTPTAPTPAVGTYNKRLSTTEFVKKFGANLGVQFAGIANNYTLSQGDSGKLVVVTAGNTINLPPANSVVSGTTFYIKHGADTVADVTISLNGNTIESSTNIVVRNETVVLQSDGGSYYRVVSRTNKLPNYASHDTLSYNTVYQASADMELRVELIGAFMNGAAIYIGFDSSTPTIIDKTGDDINNNTKLASLSAPIPAGMYFKVAGITGYDAFETIDIKAYYLR